MSGTTSVPSRLSLLVCDVGRQQYLCRGAGGSVPACSQPVPAGGALFPGGLQEDVCLPQGSPVLSYRHFCQLAEVEKGRAVLNKESPRVSGGPSTCSLQGSLSDTSPPPATNTLSLGRRSGMYHSLQKAITNCVTETFAGVRTMIAAKNKQKTGCHALKV